MTAFMTFTKGRNCKESAKDARTRIGQYIKMKSNVAICKTK